MTSKFVLKLLRAGAAKSFLPSITDVGVIGEPIFTRPSFVDTVNDIRVQYAKRNVEAIPGVDTIYVVSIGLDESGSQFWAIMSDGNIYAFGSDVVGWDDYTMESPFLIASPEGGNLIYGTARSVDGLMMVDENNLLWLVGYIYKNSTFASPNEDYESLDVGAGTRGILFDTQTYGDSPTLSKISRGQYWSGGIDISTKLWMWGCGFWGALGNDTDDSCEYAPIEPTMDDNIGWSHIYCGWARSVGIKNGDVWAWGEAASGALGFGCNAYLTYNGIWKWSLSEYGSNEYYLEKDAGGDPEIIEPTHIYQYWYGVYIGDLAKGSLGVLASGEWNWGDNDELGYSTVYVRLTNNADPDSGSDTMLRPRWRRPTRLVGYGSNWIKVTSQEHTTVALKSDGTLWVWGYNYKGSGGHDPAMCTADRKDLSPPITWCEHWKPYNITPSGKTIVDFSAGWYHIIAMEADGTAWAIGLDNGEGCLGIGEGIDSVSEWTEITTVKFLKVECQYDTNIGLGLDGKVYVWGYTGVTPYNYYVPTVWNFGTYWGE